MPAVKQVASCVDAAQQQQISVQQQWWRGEDEEECAKLTLCTHNQLQLSLFLLHLIFVYGQVNQLSTSPSPPLSPLHHTPLSRIPFKLFRLTKFISTTFLLIFALFFCNVTTNLLWQIIAVKISDCFWVIYTFFSPLLLLLQTVALPNGRRNFVKERESRSTSLELPDVYRVKSDH